MVLIRIILMALPEKRKEVMQTLLSMFETNETEKGYISHNIFCDIHEANVFSMIEEWKTREDLNRYIQSDKFGILLGTKSLLARPMEIKIHSVFRTEENDAVYVLRSQT